MNLHEWLTTKRIPSDEEWDSYFKSYGDGVQYLIDGESFLIYQETDKDIFIRDFIAFGSGLSMFNQLKKKGKTIKAMVHFSNIDLLNIVFRLGFKIVLFNGVQYSIERKVNGR